jgi:HEAT repeat protein
MRALGDSQQRVRENAITALVKLERDISNHLITALEDDNDDVQSGAAQALGNSKI